MATVTEAVIGSQPVVQPVVQPQTVTAPWVPFIFTNASLYVGDLDLTVGETQLFELFGHIGQILSIRVCRDQTRRSLGYAYVNYANLQDAHNAINTLNYSIINGKPIRVMMSHRDPSQRKSGHANVFIKNLDPAIDNKTLHDTFVSFGTVTSCKVAIDGNGQSKGYGFVQFEKDEAAHEAINRLNGMLMNDKQVYVGLFIRRQERSQGTASPKFSNVYVKNLSETVTEEELTEVFGKFGTITSALVMKDGNGNSRCFGFINFQNPDCAATAIEQLNGSTHDDKVWYVGKAQRKAERDAELRARFQQERISRFEKLQGANLYLKNLDDEINDQKLEELFAEFGTITSCKVMLNSHGQSKGSGFVAFSTPEEAALAINKMNGKMIGKKPLYVAVAQHKEERKSRLQTQFSQIRAPHMPTGMSGYHPGAPRLVHGQQLFYGQGTPGMIPPQSAGYGFQQQLLPGVRPGVSPNFMMPYHLQRQSQPGQHMGVRRGVNPQQMQHQVMMNRNPNQGYRCMANGRNGGMDPSMVPQMMPAPVSFEHNGMPITTSEMQQRAGPMPISALASALASSPPNEQRAMLGEQLYPLVERLESVHVAKVTGMLLEMDQTEVLHLIEAPDALKKKVSEAMAVLRLAKTGSENSEELSTLTLNE